ncbi:excalibur calcium-binding domain-containing protein [Kineosporia sp. NBRC 101731]|uniref:excalibur calcium-binding domain-containing protein n=1 Tax=Kineosporia sp. NBRC 101731 TaxID=3032199 RepID=UPI0024A03F8C|nr:excalibur calcium-binding domain-containing protein [Kineosporia sp. NBRC 101731]GLY30346.1 hypothetical protein Kisp02_37110 [Kineosporia sp. NBRC 101731]
MVEGWSFNPPPHWPRPPRGWRPPAGWLPHRDWGPVPPGWQLWVPTPPSHRTGPVLLGTVGLGTVGTAAAIVLVVSAALWLPRMPRMSQAPRMSEGVPAPGRLSGAGEQGRDDLAGDLVPTPGVSASGVPGPPTARRGAGGLTPWVPIPSSATVTPTAAPAPRYRSCDALTAAYPQGVGLPGAVDRPGAYRDVQRPADAPGPLRSQGRAGAGSGPPDEPAVVITSAYPAVTDFGRSTALYGANQPLDADRDGIACER